MSLVDMEILNEMMHLASQIDSKLTIEIDPDHHNNALPVRMSSGKWDYHARELNSSVMLAALSRFAMYVKGVLDEEDQNDHNEEESPKAT